jgi:hypothetical protein
MKSTQCDSVKEQVSGAWPIWYTEVMPDFKTTQRGLANLSSPLSTQHAMMTLSQRPFTYQSFLSLTLNIRRTIFLLDKHIGNSRAGLNEEQTSSQDHTHASMIRKFFTTSLR